MKLVVILRTVGFQPELKTEVIANLIGFEVYGSNIFEELEFGEIGVDLELPEVRVFEFEGNFV